MNVQVKVLRVAFVVVLVTALILRLQGVAFGLPSLYDHDEPLFGMLGLKLLRDATLNPGWFGHPGTITIYAIAVIDAGVIGSGFVLGRWHDLRGFAAAIYADPGVLVLPNRLFIVICGVACVALTWAIVRRLYGERTALIAAMLLSAMPLHIAYSQIIRTDVNASVLMLAACLFAVRHVDTHSRRDLLWSAVMVGLATATKWPAAVSILAPFGAIAADQRLGLTAKARYIIASGTVAVATLIIASPFLVLDFHTAFGNLMGERRPEHVGATSGSFFWNLGWYVANPLLQTLGLAGLALAAIGLVLAFRDRRARFTIVPVALVFFIAIAAQNLIWPRWVVPLLPFAAIFAAVAIATFADAVGKARWRAPVTVALALIVTLPMLWSARAEAIERSNDTRDRAATWVENHIPRTQSIAIEHLAMRIITRGWRFRYPFGSVGCIEAADALSGRIDLGAISKAQGARLNINFGTVDPRLFDTCRADWVVLTEADRYAADRVRFPIEAANYDRFMAAGHQVVMFEPEPGVSSGPVVRIIRLDRWPAPVTPR